MRTRLALLLCAYLAGACDRAGDRLPEYEFSGQTMGTTFSVKLVSPGGSTDRAALGERISELLDMTNRQMSTYVEDSELSRLNGNPSTGWISVSAALCDAVESALDVSVTTNGSFDVTVGPLVNLWGFGPGESRHAPPDAEEIERTQKRIGFDKLDTDCSLPAIRKALPDMYIDLSGFAKGYAVDRVADLLDEQQLQNYLVEIGGELRMRGHNAKGEDWIIAVEKPLDNTRTVQTILQLTDRAVATSGDYRNYFEFNGRRYSHTIDPGTGRPVTHDTAATTVVSDTAAEADALATALLVMGSEKAMAFAEDNGIAAYFLLRKDSGIEEHMSRSFRELRK